VADLWHHRTCESCRGWGRVWSTTASAATMGILCMDCRGSGQRQRTPTPADLVAHVVALPAEEARALLVALLRARPEEAVAAVDASKVARAWDDGMREVLGRGDCSPGEIAYNGHSRGWYVVSPRWSDVHQEYDGGSAAEAAADAALLADGWVLAKGVTP